MERIGRIGDYEVFWDQWSGRVEVGMEYAGDANSKAEAMEVAKRWVERWGFR